MRLSVWNIKTEGHSLWFYKIFGVRFISVIYGISRDIWEQAGMQLDRKFHFIIKTELINAATAHSPQPLFQHTLPYAWKCYMQYMTTRIVFTIQ